MKAISEIAVLILTLTLITCGGGGDGGSGNSDSQIIADHTSVAKCINIPDRYITAIKKMMINIPGESHSEAYRTGMSLLAAESGYSKFAVNVTGDTAPVLSSTLYLRVSRAVRSGGSWTFGTGEADWYTWYAASPTGSTLIKDHIKYCADNSYNLAVIGFGWCWDMTWNNAPGGTEDPVYLVHWAGSSDGGPDGNLRWGLDAGDEVLTGNSVCMDTYLNATESYRNFCSANGYSTKVVFTTGPVDGYNGENGYQRQLKHQYIRDFVKADSERILIDYADILSYNDDGTQNLITWTDSDGHVHTYPVITAANLGDETIGHIGAAGAIRLAKAQWYMLARIAGWDGVSE